MQADKLCKPLPSSSVISWQLHWQKMQHTVELPHFQTITLLGILFQSYSLVYTEHCTKFWDASVESAEYNDNISFLI
jgi:hypothetical protein